MQPDFVMAVRWLCSFGEESHGLQPYTQCTCHDFWPAATCLSPTVSSLAAAASAVQVEDQGPLGPVALLAEEVVRGSAAAALSQLLTAVEPR
jgi:hypothetical protein